MAIQIPPDSTGKLIETNVPDGTNHRQVVTIGDKTTAANTVAVDGTGRIKVDGSSYTQTVSGAVTATVTGTVTGNQGTAAATAGAWPVKLTDGTNVASVASLTNSKPLAVSIVDGAGTQIVSFGGGTQYADGATQATPTGTIALAKNASNILKALSIDGSGNLNVNVASGSTGNAAASNTGSAVPAQASYTGFNSAGNLVGVSSANPFPVSVQGTATVSGTVTANAGSGTFAISAATLPLPTGAATLAKQPALGTAGTASTDVITVQGIASMTALKVDGSAVTQPISGSVTANIGTSGSLALDATLTGGTQKTKIVDTAGTNVATVSAAGAVKVDGSAVTQPVSGTVTANIGSSGSLALDATLTGGTQKTKLVDTGGTNVASISAGGAVKVDGSAVTQPVSGTVSANAGTGTFATQPIGNGTVINGRQAVIATSAQLGSNACRKVCIKALIANTINIYIGSSTGVTTGTGFELGPGDAIELDISNTNLVWHIASTTGASFSWIATN